MHAVFNDINVSITVEKEYYALKVPLPYVIRNTNLLENANGLDVGISIKGRYA
jgi:hypothetical protein